MARGKRGRGGGGEVGKRGVTPSPQKTSPDVCSSQSESNSDVKLASQTVSDDSKLLGQPMVQLKRKITFDESKLQPCVKVMRSNRQSPVITLKRNNVSVPTKSKGTDTAVMLNVDKGKSSGDSDIAKKSSDHITTKIKSKDTDNVNITAVTLKVDKGKSSGDSDIAKKSSDHITTKIKSKDTDNLNTTAVTLKVDKGKSSGDSDIAKKSSDHITTKIKSKDTDNANITAVTLKVDKGKSSGDSDIAKKSSDHIASNKVASSVSKSAKENNDAEKTLKKETKIGDNEEEPETLKPRDSTLDISYPDSYMNKVFTDSDEEEEEEELIYDEGDDNENKPLRSESADNSVVFDAEKKSGKSAKPVSEVSKDGKLIIRIKNPAAKADLQSENRGLKRRNEISDDLEIQFSDYELEKELNSENVNQLSGGAVQAKKKSKNETCNESDAGTTKGEAYNADKKVNQKTPAGKPDSSKHLTGLSFVIGVKGRAKSADKVAVSPSFDCVLCNEVCIPFTGTTMHTHVKSRTHILNAMEIQYYSLFKKYESDTDTSTETLHSILTEYEGTQKAQHLTMATIETHQKVRGEVQDRIKELKNQIELEKSKDKNEEAPKTSVQSLQTVLPPINKEVYKRELENLRRLQEQRTPTNIAFVRDVRDREITLEPRFPSQFSIIEVGECNLEESYDIISNHSSFNKGTIYVFLGGNFSFVRKVELPDCKNYNCKNSVFILELTYQNPIEHALALHKKIFANTENDTVLLSGLMPINIRPYLMCAFNRRECDPAHPAKPVDIPDVAIIDYKRILRDYNEYAANHARLMGFLGWNLERGFFMSSTAQKKFIYLTANGFDMKLPCIRERKKFIIHCMQQLSATVKEQNRLKNKARAKAAAQKPQPVQPVKPAMEQKAQLVAEQKVQPTKEQKPLLPSLQPTTVSVSHNIGTKYDRIIIIANKLYEPFLQELSIEKVQIVTQDNLTIAEVKKYIIDKENTDKMKTLWISVTGIFSIVRNVKHKICVGKSCNTPLQWLSPLHYAQNVAGASTIISEITANMVGTINEIRRSLHSGGDFMVIPPIPACIKYGSAFSHSELHEPVGKIPVYYVTSQQYMSILKVIYTVFCKEVTEAAILQCDLPCSSLKDYLQLNNAIEELNNSSTRCGTSFEMWKTAVIKLLSDILRVQEPSGSIYNKVQDVDIGSRDEFKSSRIVIFDDEKNGNYPDSSVKEERARLALYPDRAVEAKSVYNRLVIIGTENLLQFSKVLNKACSGAFPPQLYWEIKYPVNWELLDDQCRKWGLENKTLFVYIPDLSMFGTDTSDTSCAAKKCKGALHYMSAAPVQSRINDFGKVIKEIKALCFSGSELLITAPLPRICIQKPLLVDVVLHSVLHEIVRHDSHPLVLEGSENQWAIAAEELDNTWAHLICSLASPEIQKSVSYFQGNHNIIDWKTSAFLLHSVSDSESLWMENFRFALTDALQIDIADAITSSEFSDKSQTHSKDKNVAHGNSDQSMLSSDVLNLLADDTGSSLQGSYGHEYSEADIFKDSQDFISSLSKVCSSLSEAPVFRKIIFIGKKELVDTFSEFGVESVTISHNLANVDDQQVNPILKKIGTIQPKTVCCLAFNVSIITETQAIANSCRNSYCKKSVPVAVMKSVKKKKVSGNEVISSRLQAISAFIKSLSLHLPVIVLPLYPSKVHCDSGKSSSSHSLTHALSGSNSYVVCGSKGNWEQHFRSLTLLWNNLLEENHSPYPSAAFIARYIENERKIFLIEENVDDFFSFWAEPTIWKTFAELVIQSVVVPKPGFTMPSKVIEGTLGSAVESSTDTSKSAMLNVWNLSDSIPKEFFTEFIKTVDSVAEINDKRNPDHYNISFVKKATAELVAYKLHECQIGDTTLRAKVVGSKGEIPPLNNVQDKYINSIFNQVYAKWKNKILANTALKINSVMDLTSFKTKKCPGNCEGVDSCVNYHDASDKRRSPLFYKYSQKMCTRPLNALGMCSLGNSCTCSHNIYEQMFYPTNFQTIPCPSNGSGKQCVKKPVCKFAHSDTPEMFYTALWEDLAVFGTQNTLSYFAGAIRGLSKTSSNKIDYKVVLISPSTEFLDVAERAVGSVVTDYKVAISTVGKKWINPESCQVFLSTPTSLTSSQNQIFNATTGGALIIDNVKKIIENSDDSDALLKFIQKLKFSAGVSSNVNKVFVSSLYDEKITGVLSRFFGLKLKEVKGPESDKTEPEEVIDDLMSKTAVPQAKRVSGSPAQLKVSSRDKDKSRAIKKTVTSYEKDRSSQSSARSHSVQGKKSSAVAEKTQSGKSSKSRSRSRSRSLSRNRDSKSDSRKSRLVGKSDSEKRHTSSSKQPQKGKEQSESEKGAVELSDPEISELRDKFGPDLFKEFMKAVKDVNRKIEEEFKVYREVSELHPDYEIYYEDFMSKYSASHLNKGEKHKETLWNQFWKVKVEDIMKQDWEQQKDILVQEYEIKSCQKTVSKKTSNNGKKWVDPDKFSVEGTFDLLESICDNVGILGPAVLAMLKSSRDLGTTTKKALNIFTDTENVTVMNLIIEKLKNLELSAPRNMAGTYHKAIEWTLQLMEFAKTGAATKEIDLNAIAQDSVGKDPHFIVNMIKTAMFDSGISDPSKDEVNQMYLKVCSIQFNMAMGN